MSTSTIRFKGNQLVLKSGEVIEIPYEILEKTCLASSYKTVSITSIVSEAVEKLTGEHLYTTDVRKSELFNSLENAIRKDERYQARKKVLMQEFKEAKAACEKAEQKRRIQEMYMSWETPKRKESH